MASSSSSRSSSHSSPSLPARKALVALLFLCSCLCLCGPSAASARRTLAESNRPPTDSESEKAAAKDLSNVLTFTPEQVAAAKQQLNASASAVLAAKQKFFQDAIATPFGQLKAGGLRAGGLVKRTNRTDGSSWLTSELALAPFVTKAFSQVSAAVEQSPVGKAFASTAAATAKEGGGENADAATEASSGSSSSSSRPTLANLLPPQPRSLLPSLPSLPSSSLPSLPVAPGNILSKASGGALPETGPVEDLTSAVSQGAKEAAAAAAVKP